MKDFEPVIICPYRFYYAPVYHAIEREYLASVPQTELVWVPEVSLGAAGSVDFAVTRKNNIEDFLCVEFQASGTTGTPWKAILEYQKTGKFSKNTYKYGMNWANEFAKTMMQQVCKKGVVVQGWKNRKIVFVFQDVGMIYLEKNYDTTGLHEPHDTDAIHFCMLKMIWNDTLDAWIPTFARKLSTDADGILRMLSGSPVEGRATEKEFIENLKRKMLAEGLGSHQSKLSAA